jgi:hypothetical protein
LANKWSIALAGDIILQKGRSSTENVDSTIVNRLMWANIRIGNLEGPITERGFPADKSISIRMPAESVQTVKDYGFDLLTRANNHACDYGWEGLADTTSLLDQVGILHCGAGMNIQEAMRPAYLEVAGLRVAVLSFCCALPPGFGATPKRPGVAPIRILQSFCLDGVAAEGQPGMAPFVFTWPVSDHVERAIEAVSRAKGSADMVLVCLHWGVVPIWLSPAQGLLAQYQQPLAHTLIDAGADCLVGHHSHTVQGIEIYHGKPVLYSLGNFACQLQKLDRSILRERPSPTSAITVDRPGELKQGAIFHMFFIGTSFKGMKLFPFSIDEEGIPRPAEPPVQKSIIDRIKQHTVRIPQPAGALDFIQI